MRTRPAVSSSAKLEGPIVKSAALTQPPTLGIHSDQGDDDQIQPLSRQWTQRAPRHGYTERAAARSAREWIEAHAAMTPVDHDGHVHADFSPTSGRDQSGGVRFPVEGQIQRDTLARTKYRQSADHLRGLRRSPAMFGGAQGAPRGAQLFS